MRPRYRSFFLLATFFSLSAHAEFIPADVCQKKHCEIIIDAGSSGTRFFLYAIDVKNFSKSYDIALLDRGYVDKALNDYNDEKIFLLLDELLKDYKTQAIPIYIYATEGLRSLTSPERKQRYALVKKWFDTQSKLHLKELRTLGGEEEGILLWIANAIELIRVHDIKSVDDTVVIEIGGASAQIVFAIKSNDLVSNKHVYPIHFLGDTIKLWSISFPTLGINNMKASYENNPSCFPKNYPMSNGQLGNGDIKACILGMNEYKKRYGLSHIDDLLKTKNLLHKESQTHRGYGFGVPDYMGSSPVLGFSNKGYYSLSELSSMADKKACHADWSFIEKNFPTVKFKERVCFSSAYIAWLAQDLFSLPGSTIINYHDSNSTPAWSKGIVIKRYTIA